MIYKQILEKKFKRLEPKIKHQIELLGHPPTLQDMANIWNLVLSEDIGCPGMECVEFIKKEKSNL